MTQADGMRLDGKVAVITGADGPFTSQIALAYAREGADLFLQVLPKNELRLPDELQAVQEACQPGRRVVGAVYDISQEVHVIEMTAHVLREFGRIDVLVNTAADPARGVFFELTEDEWDRTLGAGLKSYFLTVKHIGKEMARRATGKIINLSTILGILGSGGAVPVCASAGGIEAMTRAQAHALGAYGIHVNALARWSDGYSQPDTTRKRERLRRLAFGRMGHLTDGVGAAIFLATSDSDWVTGTVLYADGGYSVAAVTDAQHRPGGIDEVREPAPYTGP